MTPSEHYRQDLRQADFVADPAQAVAVRHTQRLYEDLLTPPARGWLSNWRQTADTRGLYLHGGTGRGKTFLIDRFYQCLPFAEKHRVHYHRFMRDIHTRLQNLPKTPDPLRIVARELAPRMRVLCLDEFHVNDIADAMIMAGLLRALLENHITLVATSNIAIDDLYKNGLQRERFLGAIDLLKQHTEEIDLGTGDDYRLRVLVRRDTYHVGQDPDVLEDYFERIAPCPAKHRRQLEINGRDIDYIALADDVVWFDFEALCATPRSSSDYIALAELFHSVVLSGVRVMGEERDDVAKRFVHLVDALYDHNVKLIISADDEIGGLYRGRRMARIFQRTVSRLMEMGGEKYLALPHRAGEPPMHSVGSEA